MAETQANLGHSTIGMTSKYTHPQLESRRASIEKLADLIDGKAK